MTPLVDHEHIVAIVEYGQVFERFEEIRQMASEKIKRVACYGIGMVKLKSFESSSKLTLGSERNRRTRSEWPELEPRM